LKEAESVDDSFLKPNCSLAKIWLSLSSLGYQTRISWSTKSLHDVIVTNRENTAELAVGMGLGFSDNHAQTYFE
jgi:hypothetical protein